MLKDLTMPHGGWVLVQPCVFDVRRPIPCEAYRMCLTKDDTSSFACHVISAAFILGEKALGVGCKVSWPPATAWVLAARHPAIVFQVNVPSWDVLRTTGCNL